MKTLRCCPHADISDNPYGRVRMPPAPRSMAASSAPTPSVPSCLRNASLLRQVVGQCYRDRPPFVTSTALRAADPPDTLAPAADLETSAVELPRFSARAVGVSAHACE